jgi:inhibitor of cysteine peptidase
MNRRRLPDLLLIFVLLMGVSCSATSSATLDKPVDEAATQSAPVSSDDPTAEPAETVEGEMVIGKALVDSVTINLMEALPAQVSVTVEGNLADGCTQLSGTEQEVDGDTIRLNVLTARPADRMCTQALVPFSQTFPLDITGLEPGTYTIDVNGVTDTLTLDANLLSPVE